jgi:hypothetical protein
MKSLVSLTTLIILLSACATAPQISEKEENRTAISNIANVEIFYHDELFPIIDLGGSGASGLSGLFGPLGAIAGVFADGVSKGTMKSRAESRTKEFTVAVKQIVPNVDINAEFANQLASQLRNAGKTVKVTQIQRPMGNSGYLASTASSDHIPTKGYAKLFIRTTTGYGAESATSSFQSLIVLETILEDERGNALMHHNETKRNFSESYFTYSGLLESHKKAAYALKNGLISMATSTYHELF